MASVKRNKPSLNGKIKTGSTAKNSRGFGPETYPMSGIFDNFNLGGGAAASMPWEMANNNSYVLVSLQRVMLTYAYVLHGPLRTLVDQPVYDAFRGGIKIKTDEVSEEEKEDLHRAIRKMKVMRAVTEAMRWDRLFGGAGIIINTDQDFKEPLDINKINEKSKLEFIAADRWEIAWNGVPQMPKSSFTYYGKTIDQSRVARIVGETPPSLVKMRLQGWGMSSIECVIREINAYFKNNNVIFELLDEAKIDVWKIKGFNSQILSAIAQGKTAKRIQIATMMKNFLNAITLDKEDDYEQKTMTFTGLSDMLEQIRIGIAAAVRMPMAKIFGLASKGFASGEDDIENYNAIVHGQRDRADEVLEVIIPILMMKVWGFVPDDWSVEYKPLRVLSAEQEQNVLNSKHTRNMDLYDRGLYTPQEVMEAEKNDGIVSIETEVAKGADPEPPINMMGLEDGGDDGGEPKKKKSDGKKPTKAEE